MSAASSARIARERERLASAAAASRPQAKPEPGAIRFGSDYSRRPIPGQLALFVRHADYGDSE